MPWSDAFGSLWPAADNLRRRREEVIVREDIPYAPGGNPKRRLDLYLPRGEGPFPVAVFFHGDFWKGQDRRVFQGLSGLYGNVGVALALEGFATAVPGFRQDAPAHAEEDARAAVRWLRLHAQVHDLDPERVSLVGHAAGGTLALTLAGDPAGCAGPVRAVASLGAVHDLPRLLAAGLPPALLVTCDGDAPALRAEHASTVAAGRAAGAACEALEVAGVGHVGLILEVGRRRDRVGPALVSFLRARVGPPSPDALDLRAVGRAVFRPARPKLDAVRAAVAGTASVEAAWDALATSGLLPAVWRDAATRRFSAFVACSACGGSGAGDHGGPCLECFRSRTELAPPRATPPSLGALVALASLSDETVEAAEDAAWESVEALAPWAVPPPWGAVPPRRVCWAVASRASWHRKRAQTQEPSRHARAACLAANVDVDAIERAMDARLPGEVPCLAEAAGEVPGIAEAAGDVIHAAVWQAAVRAGLRVPACRDAHEGSAPPVGRPFAELPDPHAARCALWRLGVALDGVEPDGTVVIVVAG